MRHLLTNSEVPLGNKRANLKLESEFQNVAIPFFYIQSSFRVPDSETFLGCMYVRSLPTRKKFP